MSCPFFIVSNNGYVLPYGYDNYETVCANCEGNEMVYLAESLEELENCLDNQPWDPLM